MGFIKKVTYTNGVSFFYDTDNPKHNYGRIVGGVGWRGKRPGFIVAVGEDLEPDKNLNDSHLWVLREYESEDTLKMLNKALELRDFESVTPWIGDTENQVEMSFLKKVNERIPPEMYFRIDLAPNADDPKAFDFCLNVIKRALDPHKLLHLGESKIKEYMGSINDDNVNSFGVLDFPAITALGNVIAYIREHRLDPYRNLDYNVDEETNQRYNYLSGELE